MFQFIVQNSAQSRAFFLFQLIVFYITTKVESGDAKSFDDAARYVAKMLVTSHIYDNILNPHRGIGRVFDVVS
jgi:hypothetical protein